MTDRYWLVAVVGLASVGCKGEWFRKPEPLSYVPHQEGTVGLFIPSGAAVKVEQQQVQVDAADGFSWYDVRWIAQPEDPQEAATLWANERCKPILWDFAVNVGENSWFAGGLCNIEERRYWVNLLIENRDDKALLTGLMATYGVRTYEELWWEFFSSSLTVGAGTPAPVMLSLEELRAEMQAAQKEMPQGIRPTPGGGMLSSVLALRLKPYFEQHLAQEVPQGFEDGVSTP